MALSEEIIPCGSPFYPKSLTLYSFDEGGNVISVDGVQVSEVGAELRAKNRKDGKSRLTFGENILIFLQHTSAEKTIHEYSVDLIALITDHFWGKFCDIFT